MNHYPVKLELSGNDALRIVWNDERTDELSFRTLRKACPCATCREKADQPPPDRNSLNIITEAQTQPLKIVGMSPVGNYAYSIQFSDGHDTGIFTLDMLRELGTIGDQ